MTLDEAKSLPRQATVYHVEARNADGSALRARVNGNICLWKANPGRIRIPMKHGLNATFQLTEANLHEWLITDPTGAHQ